MIDNKELSGFCKVIEELSNDNDRLKQSLEDAYYLMGCGRYSDAKKVLKALKGGTDSDIGRISFITGKEFNANEAILSLIKNTSSNRKLLKGRELIENGLLTNGTIDTSHILEIRPQERMDTLKKLDPELVRLAILYDNIVRGLKKIDLADKYCITDFCVSGILLNGWASLTEETLRFPKQYENWLTVEDFLNIFNTCNIDNLGIKVYSVEKVLNTYLKGYTVEEISSLSNLPLESIVRHLENNRMYQKMSSKKLSIFKLRAYFGVEEESDLKIMFETYQRAYKRYRMIIEMNLNGLENNPFENRRIHWNYNYSRKIMDRKPDNARDCLINTKAMPERMVSKI